MAISKLPGILEIIDYIKLSKAASEALGKKPGFIGGSSGNTSSANWMERRILNGPTELTDNAAELLANPEHKHWARGVLDRYLTALSADDAEVLANSMEDINLDGLTELTEAAAKALAEHKGDIILNGLTTINVAAAKALAEHERDLFLKGLATISVAAAEALAMHKGDIVLNGLTEIDDAAAEGLAKHKGGLYLRGLSKLTDGAAKALSRKAGQINNVDPAEWAASLRV